MGKYLVLAMAFLAIISSPIIALSQETEESEYSYGSIVEVKKDTSELVVSEYDWDSDAEVSVTYTIPADVKLENAASWKDIPNGTYVDIEYVTQAGGKKVAKGISVYEAEAEGAAFEEEAVTEEVLPAAEEKKE